jgi:hypothetical protein
MNSIKEFLKIVILTASVLMPCYITILPEHKIFINILQIPLIVGIIYLLFRNIRNKAGIIMLILAIFLGHKIALLGKNSLDTYYYSIFYASAVRLVQAGRCDVRLDICARELYGSAFAGYNNSVLLLIGLDVHGRSKLIGDNAPHFLSNFPETSSSMCQISISKIRGDIHIVYASC